MFPLADLSISLQLLLLFVLPIPVASIAWTFTQEEIFREPREWCRKRSARPHPWLQRKFFYMLTCEYCFSHYVAGLVLLITRYHLGYGGWPGLFVAWFSLIWIANLYMSLYGRIRLDIKRERVEIAAEERKPSPVGR